MKDKQLKKLVVAMEKGDNKAFEKLYEETKKTVYFTCLSFLGNEQDAQDVMQEVYITAYNKISQLQDKDKFVPWINQIAVNRCKNQLVKNVPIPMDPEDYTSMPMEEGEIFLPEDYIIDKEKRKIIMDIMRSCLSDIQYKTVILFYFNGLSVNEIADIMECMPGTVTNRLCVARAKIKQGILHYEGANDYRLHSFTGTPFLASILTAEAVGLQVPDIFPNMLNLLQNAAGTGVAGGTIAGVIGSATAKTTAALAKTGLALKAKIAIAVATTVVVGGGAAIVIHNQNKEEPKSVVEYKALEPMLADELRNYFVEEYGFVQQYDYELENKEETMMGYHLTLENENGGFRVDIQYVVENNKVKNIQFYNYEKKGKDNLETYIEMCGLLVDNSEEKEQLTNLIETNIEERKQIGNEIYSFRPHYDAYYISGELGFSGEIAEKSNLIIIVDW